MRCDKCRSEDIFSKSFSSMIKHVKRVFNVMPQTYGQVGEQFFVFNCGAQYSKCHSVIRNKVSNVEVEDLNSCSNVFVLS